MTFVNYVHLIRLRNEGYVVIIR